MKPLSAVAVSIWLILYGLIYANVFAPTPTPSAIKAEAIIAIIVAVIVLLDTFWLNSDGWVARRNPPA